MGSVQIDKWSLGLECLLQDPKGVVAFTKYLESEFSSENIRFWLLCKAYKASLLTELQEKAEKIFQMFLSRKAEYQVDVSVQVMADIKEGMKNPTYATFLEAQKGVFRVMERDGYPRFLQMLQESILLTPKKKRKKRQTFSCNLL